jgi:hypothetical protein
MKQKVYLGALLYSTFLSVSALSAEAKLCSKLKSPVFYSVQSQDQLGDIVRTFGLKPLWGAHFGYVGKVAEQSSIKNPDYIRPGYKVDLPFKCEEDLSKYVVIERKSRREIDPQFLVRVRTNAKRSGEWRTVLVYPDGREIPFVDEEFMFSENRSQKRKFASEEAAIVAPVATHPHPSKNLWLSRL